MHNSMARRTSTKIEPAVMTLALQLPIGPASSTIDLSQICSLVNRRFYRQGLNWACAGFKIVTQGATTGGVTVSKLPNTWVTSNAWEKAFRAWNKQQMDSIEEAGAESAVARFRDFKIFADVAHVAAGYGSNLLPIDLAGAPYATGEWEPSQVVIPNIIPDASGTTIDPQEVLLHMVGINNNGGNSRGIIEGYADSRAFPQSPDPVSPDINSNNNWLRQMFDVGNDNSDITDNATNRNDDLPYPQVDYPGGETQAATLQLHDTTIVSGTTIGGTTRLKGGNFPCGLIRFNTNLTAGDQVPILLIDLVPGNHRGYLCEPMMEM